MPRERFNLFGSEAECDAIPQAEVWLAMTETKNLEAQVEQIFEALRLPVYQYLLSVFGEPAEAEDLTQEAFFSFISLC